MTDPFSTFDAAYLLGALTPADRADYEAHLAECPNCRRAVNQLAGMPGLLAAVPPDQARAVGAAAPAVPETLLPRLLAEVQRTRFRRRMTTALVGVAAAAVLAVALVVGLRGPASDDAAKPPTTSVAQRMAPVVPGAPIRATARLTDAVWGTRVVVRCVYKGGDAWPEKLTYTMVVVDKSGHTQHVAGWVAEAGAPIVVDGSTSVPQSQIASVEIRTSEGKPILALHL
jgi:anti-sigma factor RsiW